MELRKEKKVLGGNAVLHFFKPNFCPHCGIGIDANCNITPCSDGYYFAIFTCTIGDCAKKFSGFYKIATVDDKNYDLDLLYTYPSQVPPNLGKFIRKYSPEFVRYYQQAFESESLGNIELAACGYRNAIEVMIKDYVFTSGKKTNIEKLHDMSLDKCIELFIEGMDEIVSAYAVKEFGNSSAHYPPLEEQPPLDFEEFKKCLAILISRMDEKFMTLDFAKVLPSRFAQKLDLPSQ